MLFLVNYQISNPAQKRRSGTRRHLNPSYMTFFAWQVRVDGDVLQHPRCSRPGPVVLVLGPA